MTNSSAVSTLPFQATALSSAPSRHPDTVPMPDTPLHSACRDGDAARSAQLIQNGAKLNAKDEVRQSR